MHRTQDWWQRPTILVALGMVGLGAALLWSHITSFVSPPSRAEQPQGLALTSMGTELLVRPDPRPVSVPSDPIATPEPPIGRGLHLGRCGASRCLCVTA